MAGITHNLCKPRALFPAIDVQLPPRYPKVVRHVDIASPVTRNIQDQFLQLFRFSQRLGFTTSWCPLTCRFTQGVWYLQDTLYFS